MRPPCPRWDTVLDVDFREGGHRFHTLSGWSEPDWTVGPRFTIDAGGVPARNRLFVRLRATPFGHQRVRLDANGVPLGAHAGHLPFTASFPVPAAVIGAEGGLRLGIDIEAPTRPCDVGAGTDQRPLGLAIARIELLGTDAPDRTAWPEALARDDGRALSDAALLGSFESLGDNCEFGFVQKRANVAGSALLRFCATPSSALLAGLGHGFAAIDDPDSVSVVEDGPPGAREYQIRIARYGLHYHTLTFTHETDGATLLARELSKLRHKHAKFLAGLARGDRIYVVKQNDGLPIGTVWSIWLALQRFAPAVLLRPRLAEQGEAPGRVTALGPGLLDATVPAFASYTDATGGDDAVWLGLCREARAFVAEVAAGSAVGTPPDAETADRGAEGAVVGADPERERRGGDRAA